MRHMKYGLTVALPENFSFESVKRVMEARGYRWVQRIPKEEYQFAEEIWLLPNGHDVVRYVYDHLVEVPCINAGSNTPDEAPKILADLETDLPLLYPEDLLAPALASDWRRYALRALASIKTGFHGDVANAFITALKDPEPNIREFALVCMGRCPSFIFVKELEAQARIEEYPGIKKWELGLAESIRQLNKHGTLIT